MSRRSVVLLLVACARETTPVNEPASNPTLAPSASAQAHDCTSDSECLNYMDCCGAAFTCGTAQAKASYEQMCACCVSCSAPTQPAKPVTCACTNGACVAR